MQNRKQSSQVTETNMLWGKEQQQKTDSNQSITDTYILHKQSVKKKQKKKKKGQKVDQRKPQENTKTGPGKKARGLILVTHHYT